MVNILHTVHTHSARWFVMAFLDATACTVLYTKIFGTNFTCYAKKDSH